MSGPGASPHPDPLPLGGEGERNAKELENSLREGGEKVSQGRIRIDSARALQRLRDFRFAEPAHWALEVLRAATLSGAKNVEVRTDADDVEISFDGRPFPPDGMKHLLEQALNGGSTPDEKRTRLLALGTAGALGMGAHFVKVHSGGVALTLENEKVEVVEQAGTGTSLHLRKAFGWRVAAAFLRGSPEALAITQRAHRFPAKLTLNGQVVLGERAAPSAVKRVAEGEGWRLEVVLPEGGPLRRSELELDVGGVLVARRTPWLDGLQLQAWVRADGVRRNASGSDVVDDDPMLLAALTALRQLSLELLKEQGPKLATDERWRQAFLKQLLEEDTLDPEARPLLHRVPLIPGPSGETSTLFEITEAAREHSRVYVAKQPWTQGSYPTPAVLLVGDLSFTKLLPPGRRVDVEPLVKQKELIALNRQRLERAPVEKAVLLRRNWVAKAPLTATAVSGEVGFEAGGNGAFVRVLHRGRQLEAGELPSLAPLRLRAVVDWSRPLGDSFFDDRGASKLLGLVAKYVEVAATKAICDALPSPEVLPHALDLLTRLVVLRDSAPAQLPAALFAAPLFPCLGGADVSLELLQGEARWRFVNARVSQGLLDGSRVLVLSAAQRDILKKLGPKRLEDVTVPLRDEQEVRRRLSGPKRAAVVKDVVASVTVEAEGLRGEVGVPRDPGARLSLTLLKSGLELETTELSPRYHHAVATIDCDALLPNARWTGATRDGAFKAVNAAVHEAQRRLAAALVAVPRKSWPQGAELFLLAFLRKELRGFDPSALDEVARAVAEAPLFTGAHGLRSLMQLKAQAGPFFVLSTSSGVPSIPPGFEVLLEPASLTAVLGETLGRTPEDATEALTRLLARRQLEALPVVPFLLPVDTLFPCRVSEGPFTLLAGLCAGTGDEAEVQVQVEGRAYATVSVSSALPLVVVLEAPTFEPSPSREPSSGQLEQVRQLVERAVHAVLQRALEPEAKADPQAHRALLLALARRVDQILPQAAAEALRSRELIPCTDGVTRGFKQLEADGAPPQFVLGDLRGELPNRRPIVLAGDPLVRAVLNRWPRAEEVDLALTVQLTALRARAALAPVREIVSRVESPWRKRLSESGLTGEVVVAREGAGRLELFLEHKPLCVLEGVLPGPLAGAVDSPRLTPQPGFSGVVDDEHLEEIIDALKVAGNRLAVQLASVSPPAPWETAHRRLAFWIAASTAWEWKGKKKARGKNKKAELKTHVASHPLLAAALLRASDGSPLSLVDLITSQRAEGRVLTTQQGGRFLDAGRQAWWPRPDEGAWAAPLGLTLVDVTEELQLAESIRQRPRFAELVAPLASAWREPVTGPSLEGEVALGAAPDGILSIEVLHERKLLERWSSPHPVGGVARVNSEALSPDERWTAAKRDAAFKAMVSATEAALERLVVRRLAKPGLGYRLWASAAIGWRAGQGGELAALVPGLALFSDVEGRSVTVGTVMDLSSRKGRVPLSHALRPDEAVQTLVLLDSEDTRATLTKLGLAFEDVSGELRRAKDLEQALTARRLATLTWKGDALVKLPVSTGPLSGELALTREVEKSGVLLARDGIAIGLLEDAWPGVVGVIDVKDLTVNDDWTTAQPTRAQRTLIRAQVELLFLRLAEAASSFGERERELGACWALRFLADGGVEAAAHLDRLTGAAQALADAPLFLTVEGERVNLRTIAGEVSSRERVAVFTREASLPGGADFCVLATSSWEAPWLVALEGLLGKSKVRRVTELAAWQLDVREADPPEGTPELGGLRFLRREVRLLRAGALGQLTPDDLEDVRLSRAGGATALRYDRQRKLALLDPDHPGIARALQEAAQRPERLWVLIAALFGLVNRELDHVTDAHEAQLLMALAGHLASNPRLLA